MILRGNVAKSVLDYKLVSDRIMIVKLKADPVNMMITQVYAPNEDEEEEEKERFYDMLDEAIKEQRKGR